jgi:hypothetical protein
MPTGDTTTQALADSLPTVVASARIVREYEGVMPQLVDSVSLGEGDGLSWHEVSFAQLDAQRVTETTIFNNPQQMSDTLFSLTPVVAGVHTVITDRVAARIASVAYAKLGSLAMNAIQRLKDLDGLTILDGATTSLGGAGSTGHSGLIAAAQARIAGNATEPGNPPYYAVLHPFQVKDLYDEITAPVGTYDFGDKVARVFEEGFKGSISSALIFEDGNITVDASDDAKGGVFAKEAIVLVQGRGLRTETRREPHIGGGATSVWIYDEYVYGERSAGNWLFEIYTDATAPTS